MPEPLVKRGKNIKPRSRNKDGTWKKKRSDVKGKRLQTQKEGRAQEESISNILYPKMPEENTSEYWDTIPGKLCLALNDEVLGVSSQDTEQFIEPITKMMNQLSNIEEIINRYRPALSKLRMDTIFFSTLFHEIEAILDA